MTQLQISDNDQTSFKPLFSIRVLLKYKKISKPNL